MKDYFYQGLFSVAVLLATGAVIQGGRKLPVVGDAFDFIRKGFGG